MDRFIIQKSTKSGYTVCTDLENKIVCVFENHNFNENQKFTTLEDFDYTNANKLATYTREMGDYLFKNHYNLIF